MGNHFKTVFFEKDWDGTLGALTAANLRMIICLDTTTVDTEEDVLLMNGFTTLAEHAGTNYARKILGTKALSRDDANDRAEFDCADVTWTALGAGASDMAGVLVYLHVTDDTDSIPLAWIDTVSGSPSFPLPSNGGDFTYAVHADGLFHLANAA